jgi:hypothetical protein
MPLVIVLFTPRIWFSDFQLRSPSVHPEDGGYMFLRSAGSTHKTYIDISDVRQSAVQFESG